MQEITTNNRLLADLLSELELLAREATDLGHDVRDSVYVPNENGCCSSYVPYTLREGTAEARLLRARLAKLRVRLDKNLMLQSRS
jgi:hypothetical protein